MPNILSLLTWWNFFIAGAGWSLFWLASANNGSEVWGFFLLQQYLCVQSTLRILQGPPWTLSIRLFNWIWCKDNVVLQTTYKQLGPQGPWPTVVGPLLCCVDSPQWDSALAGAISRTSLVQPTCLLYLDEPGKAFASSWLYGFQRGECGHSSLAAGGAVLKFRTEPGLFKHSSALGLASCFLLSFMHRALNRFGHRVLPS